MLWMEINSNFIFKITVSIIVPQLKFNSNIICITICQYTIKNKQYYVYKEYIIIQY